MFVVNTCGCGCPTSCHSTPVPAASGTATHAVVSAWLTKMSPYSVVVGIVVVPGAVGVSPAVCEMVNCGPSTDARCQSSVPALSNAVHVPRSGTLMKTSPGREVVGMAVVPGCVGVSPAVCETVICSGGAPTSCHSGAVPAASGTAIHEKPSAWLMNMSPNSVVAGITVVPGASGVSPAVCEMVNAGPSTLVRSQSMVPALSHATQTARSGWLMKMSPGFAV